MSSWQQILLDLWKADHTWLSQCIAMKDWDSKCLQMCEAMVGWIADYTAQFCENPGRISMTLQGTPLQQRQMKKLWGVWRHHWHQQTKLNGANSGVDPFEVAENLQLGYGPIIVDDSDSHRARREVARVKLGGNPLSDMILSDAILENDSQAIGVFSKRFHPLAASLYRKRHNSSLDDDWWTTFQTDYIMNRALETYRGESGLSVFVGKAMIRSLSRPRQGEVSLETRLVRFTPEEQWRSLNRVLTPDRMTEISSELVPDQKSGNSTYEARVRMAKKCMSHEERQLWDGELNAMATARKEQLSSRPAARDNAEQQECRALIQQLLTNGLQSALKPQQVLVLYQSLVKGETGKAIAELIRKAEGNVSRNMKAGARQLRSYIEKRVNTDDRFADSCRECLEILGTEGLVAFQEILETALTDTSPLLPDLSRHSGDSLP